ncbi:hypothetical protein BZA77DRAFT_88861 [Pyronema omphalodes]|nr:hypothetical protein BZA77DRAFT_88861 [Pyronema omphalodes]
MTALSTAAAICLHFSCSSTVPLPSRSLSSTSIVTSPPSPSLPLSPSFLFVFSSTFHLHVFCSLYFDVFSSSAPLCSVFFSGVLLLSVPCLRCFPSAFCPRSLLVSLPNRLVSSSSSGGKVITDHGRSRHQRAKVLQPSTATRSYLLGSILTSSGFMWKACKVISGNLTLAQVLF